jgi:4-hydroxybenzoate polyprenyltransferase
MLQVLSERLLPALQLTRMALVLTAVSNSLCTYLLALQSRSTGEVPLWQQLQAGPMVLIALIAIGLYGFGMALNDIIDRRRDRQLAAYRPLPSGRIRLATAYAICLSLVAMAVICSIQYARMSPSRSGWMSIVLMMWTGLLIAFYDLAGKYLVATGLLALGLIRFFNAVIPSPQLPVVWHPVLLFTHVTVLSAVAYVWEGKRPPLTRLHWWVVLGGVALIDVLAVGGIYYRSYNLEHIGSIWPVPGLLLPAGAVVAFTLLAIHIRRHSAGLREAGQSLMLAGLLWLIVYDSAFVAAYVGLPYGLGLLGLLPLSYLGVQCMRWWSRLVLLSQQPTYKRQRGVSKSGRGGEASGTNNV